MNAFKKVSVFAASLVLLTTVGCAALDDDITVAEAVDDATITTKVKAALVADDDLEATEIKVATSQGVVQLSGFVDERDDISKATDLARRIQGVKSVRNDITMK